LKGKEIVLGRETEKGERWHEQLPVFIGVPPVMDIAGMAMPQRSALANAAACHDVSEAKGVSNEWQEPCKNLYY
jgi:hypothetical protein